MTREEVAARVAMMSDEERKLFDILLSMDVQKRDRVVTFLLQWIKGNNADRAELEKRVAEM